MSEMLLPCLRALVGDRVSYFCNLTSGQVTALAKRAQKQSRVNERTGLALVRGADDTEWFPVKTERPAWFSGSARALDGVNNTISVLRLGEAQIVELQLPASWRRGRDCLIEFSGIARK